MSDFKLQQGDCFVVKTDGWVSAPIRFIEKWQSLDGEATYNHAGIIVSDTGQTFESLEKIDHYKLDDYKGCQILIFRRIEMTQGLFWPAYKSVLKYDGKVYPAWRMPLFILRIAKWFRWTFPVCSELVMMFECGCGLRKKWAGYSPDNIADEVRISKFYQIKFEGVWS
jgi:hypothetical protein